MRIRLIGTVNIAPVFGHDGHIIDVTPENQDVVESLVLCGSAKVLKDAAEEVIVTSTGPQLEKLSPDQLPKGVLDASKSGLNLHDNVAALSNFEIHGRYTKALTDAGVITIADVVAKGDKLVEIPGISEAAAKKIASVLKDKLDIAIGNSEASVAGSSDAGSGDAK
jgi:hypothetical protein